MGSNEKRCFVLGSGPSIAEEDLLSLRRETTFCSNWFINHSLIDQLNIDYYSAYDDQFVDPEPNRSWLQKLGRLPEAIKFFPLSWRPLRLPLENMRYVKTDFERKVYREGKLSVDLDVGLWDAGTVIINLCIPLAVNLGYRQIILLGCECNYGISRNQDYRDAYFYDLSEHATPIRHDANGETDWQAQVLASYEVVSKTCEKLGVSIINATRGGALETFPRKPLRELL